MATGDALLRRNAACSARTTAGARGSTRWKTSAPGRDAIVMVASVALTTTHGSAALSTA